MMAISSIFVVAAVRILVFSTRYYEFAINCNVLFTIVGTLFIFLSPFH